MNKITLILVIVSAFIAVNSIPIENELYAETSEDVFVDKVLNTTRSKYMAVLEPYHLLNSITFPIHSHSGGKTFNGSVTATNVYVTGLSYITRYESSTNGPNANQFVAHLNFGDDNLKLHALAHIEFMGLEPNVTVEATINDLRVNVTVGKETNGKATVVDVKPEGLTNIKIHIVGPFGNFDPLVNSREDNLIKGGNPIVKAFSVKLVKEVVGRVFNQYSYPNK